ncbi:unnamed protein product, partial [Rotaria sordida]
MMKNLNEHKRESADLKNRINVLEHVIFQLQNETEIIDVHRKSYLRPLLLKKVTFYDYIHLNQQQHEQLQKRYEEKDIYFEQLTQDRVYLQ